MDSEKVFESDKRLKEAIDFWIKNGCLVGEQIRSDFGQNPSMKFRLTPDGELLANLMERLGSLPSKGQFILLISILRGRINEVM